MFVVEVFEPSIGPETSKIETACRWVDFLLVTGRGCSHFSTLMMRMSGGKVP